MPIVPGRVTDGRLRRLAVAARARPWSYDERGATAAAALPPGYRAGRYGADLGGPEAFDRAVDGLRRWEAHRGAGARVVPADAPLREGETVVVALGLGLATLVAPCRIVYVTEEPDRFGFAYGTLTGHPAQGEESFHVARIGWRTRVDVVAFSRPAGPVTRLGAPVAGLLQDAIARRYLRGLRAFVDRG